MSSLPTSHMVALAALMLLVIIVVTVIGQFALVAVRAPDVVRPVAPAVGLALIIGISWPLQAAGVSMQTISTVCLLLAILGVVAAFLLPRHLAPRAFLLLRRADIWALAVSIAATIAFLEPALRRYGLSLASLGNADPVSYALDARASLDSGFQPSDGVLNRDLNWSASWNWPGAVTVQALVSGLTGRPAGLASLASIAVVVVIGQWMTSVLIRNLSGSASRGPVGAAAPFVAAVAWLNPFGAYLVGNGFLAQLVSIMLVMALCVLLTTQPALRDLSTGPTALVAALLTGAACATFTAIAPAVIISLIVIRVVVSRITSKQAASTGFTPAGTSAVALALLMGAGGWLWFSYNGVLVTTEATAGWPMHVPGGATLLGLVPFLGEGGAANSFGAIGWLGFAVIVALLGAGLLARDKQRIWRASLGAVVLLTMAGGVVLFGADTYKAWKLWGFVAPLLLAAAGASVLALVAAPRWRQWRIGLAGAGIVVALALSGGAIWNSSREWSLSPYTFGASPQQVELLSDARLVSIRGVNVAGQGPVETMMLLLFAGTPSRLATTASFYKELPARYPQTLTGTAQAASLRGAHTEALNDAYVLTSVEVGP